MSKFTHLIDKDNLSVVSGNSRIPIKQVSYLSYGRRYSWYENFLNALKKGLTITIGIFLIIFIDDYPIVYEYIDLSFVRSFKDGAVCGGLPNCEINTSSKLNAFAGTFFFSTLLCLANSNPLIVNIVSSSNNSIVIEYEGKIEEVNLLFDEITSLASE